MSGEKMPLIDPEWQKEEERWTAFARERENEASRAGEKEKREVSVKVAKKSDGLPQLKGNNDVVMAIKAFYAARKIDFVGLLKVGEEKRSEREKKRKKSGRPAETIDTIKERV